MIPPRIVHRHRGPAGRGIPTDGQHGQILAKDGVEPFKTKWVNPPSPVDAVSGPETSVDGELMLFSGTSGTVAKNSGVLLSELALASQLANKVDKVTGKGLSTNDFSNFYKNLLDTLPPGRFRGVFATVAALRLAIPSATAGDYAYIQTPGGDPPLLAVWYASQNDWDTIGADTIVTGSDIFSDLDTYDKANCRLFTTTEKAQVAYHETVVQQLVGGGNPLTSAIRDVSANTTVGATDRTINVVTNSITVSLPAAASNQGRYVTVKNSGGGTVTVDANASELIDGVTTVTLTSNQAITIQCTGSGWISLSSI